jgi:hypothetical protein
VTAGALFNLTADAGTWRTDFDIAFFASLADCQAGAALPYKNHAGDERSVVPGGAAMAVVTLRFGDPGAAFTYQELPPSARGGGGRRPTVVAVLEPYDTTLSPNNGFVPYYRDFLGSEHPWNTDESPATTFDAYEDPANYLDGYPGAQPVPLTLPKAQTDVVADLATADAAAWRAMEATAPNTTPKLYRFPGTKVVGAIKFGPATGPGTGDLHAIDTTHASSSASVAAGNIHGTCPDCVVVFVSFLTGQDYAALAWVAAQPWIDVVTNSYGYATGLYPGQGEEEVTLPAVVAGQSQVWAAGNGTDGDFLVPGASYQSGRSGADWHITVGAVDTWADQSDRAMEPVDIASYGDHYPSAGSTTVGGDGQHSGTSNAAPVVAGTLAEIIGRGRDLLHDGTVGHHDGVVASGDPVHCRAAEPACPLGDGVLTRAEAQRVLFDNVLPSPNRVAAERLPAPHPAIPSAPGLPGSSQPTGADPSDLGLSRTQPAVFTYQTQGYGIVYGTYDRARFQAEQRRFADALVGAVAPYVRPSGEHTWMVVDSKCRQRLWLPWSEGEWTGTDPVFDPTVDQPAMAADAACSALPQGFNRTVAGVVNTLR